MSLLDAFRAAGAVPAAPRVGEGFKTLGSAPIAVLSFRYRGGHEELSPGNASETEALPRRSSTISASLRR